MTPAQQARSEAAKRALVDAAIELIAAHGVAGVTIRAVAARARVSKSLAGHHFATRDELIAAVARALLAFEPPAVGAENGPLIELAAYCSALLPRGGEAATRALQVLLGEVQTGNPRGGAIGDWQRAMLLPLRVLLKRGMDSGEIRADIDVDAQALLILAMVQGAIWIVLTRGEPLEAPLSEALGAALITALGARWNPRPGAA